MRCSAIVLFLVTACISEPLADGEGSLSAEVRTSVDIPGVRLEGGVVSDCARLLERDWERAVEYPLPLQVDGQINFELPMGEYGLAARIVNADCEVVAFGCLPLSIGAGATAAPFVVVVDSVALGSSCRVGGECSEGFCGPPPSVDAGPSLPDGVTVSPDGEGYCAAPEGFHCGCVSLDHYCTALPCVGHNFACDVPLGDLRSETDDHGCIRYVLFDSGDFCP